jgi:hypothetical protein
MLEWKEPGVIAESEGSGAHKKLVFEGDEAGKYVPRSGTPPPPPSVRAQAPQEAEYSEKEDGIISGLC